MSADLSKLDNEMMSALLDWRQRAGRSWKQKLQIAWMTGGDESDPRGSALRHIRNHLGPSWLDRLRPRDLDAAAEKRGVTALRNSLAPSFARQYSPGPPTPSGMESATIGLGPASGDGGVHQPNYRTRPTIGVIRAT